MYNLLNLPVPVEHTDWGADCIVLVCLCRALDCSKFHYRCIVYGSAHWSVLNQGLHIALGAFRTSPAQSLYVEAHKLSLTFRRLKLSLNYVLKLKSKSIYIYAELQAILLAIKHVYCSRERLFMILSDSLLSLQAIFNLKYDHPIWVQILELYMNLTRDGKKIVFVWVPGDNLAANSAAKDAVGDISVER